MLCEARLPILLSFLWKKSLIFLEKREDHQKEKAADAAFSFWWSIRDSNSWPLRFAFANRSVKRIPTGIFSPFLWGVSGCPSHESPRLQKKNRTSPSGYPILLVIHRRFELRTPWLKVRCSASWANGSCPALSRLNIKYNPLPFVKQILELP